MRDHNLRPVSTDLRFRAEVRLIRWGESSTAGRTITLELPPDEGDGHPFKGFPTGHAHGQRFWMAFEPIADDEMPIPSDGGQAVASVASDLAPDRGINRGNPIEQGVIHTFEIPAPTAKTQFGRTPDLDSSVFPDRTKSPAQPGCGMEQAGLTPKARYAAMTAGEQARTRAGKLPREDERFRVWAASEKAGGGARPMYALSEAAAAQFIRDRCCGGNSRRAIATDPEAMDKFIALETAFKIAVGEIAEPR